jgi:hypothetical protein
MTLSDWIACLLIIAALLSILVATSLGFLKLAGWIKRKVGKPEAKPAPSPQPKTPPWIWVFLIALVALVTYVVSGKGQKPPGQPIEPVLPGGLILYLVGVIFAVVVGGIAIQIFRQYDRDVIRAFKLANAGDKDGALFDLKASMEGRKPSAIRTNAVGALHAVRDEWTEAYKAFLEAEAIGGHQAIYVGNQGIALTKLGRLSEGETLLAEACAMDPNSAILACMYGEVLTELGRLDEAGQQLAKAKKAYKTTLMFPPSAKKPLLEEIEKLRQKLEAAQAPEKDLGLEEL